MWDSDEPSRGARLPDFDRGEWRLEASSERQADERNRHALTFELWRRRAAP